MFVWGRGEHGRLGLGDERGASKLLPTKLELPDGERVKQVSCGGSHTLFLTTSRKVTPKPPIVASYATQRRCGSLRALLSSFGCLCSRALLCAARR